MFVVCRFVLLVSPLFLSGCFAGLAGVVLGFVAVSDDSGDGQVLPPASVKQLDVSWATSPDAIDVEFSLTAGRGGRLSAKVEYVVLRDQNGKPVNDRGPRRSTPRPGSHGLEDVPAENARRFIWDAKKDLEDRSAQEVVFLVTPLEDGMPQEPRRSRPFRAGNTPPEIRDIALLTAGNRVSPVFDLVDSESDPVELLQVGIAVGEEAEQVLTKPFVLLPRDIRGVSSRILPSSPEGVLSSLVFDVRDLNREGIAPDVQALSCPGFVGFLRVKLWVRDFPADSSELEGPDLPERFDNNESPELTLEPILPEQHLSGVIPLRYRLFDAEGNPAKVEVKVDLGDGHGLRLAQEFPSSRSDGVRGSEQLLRDLDDCGLVATETDGGGESRTFLWDAMSQARGNESVTLRVVASDRETSVETSEHDLSIPWLSRSADIGAGRTPVALESCDFNQDGFLDVVVASVGSSEVTHLRGGPRGLTWHETLAVGTGPVVLVSGYFDEERSGGDAFPDLVVGSRGGGNLTWLQGGPDGLRLMRDVLEGANPAALTSGDHDGDGVDDVVVADESARAVVCLRGSPEGLALFQTFQLGSEPTALASGFFDGDELLDAVVAEREGRVTCLRGGPEGFGPLELDVVVQGPSALATGDYNDDGIDDVVVAGAAGVSVFQGGPGCLRWVKDVETASETVALTTTDHNGDGVADVVAAHLAMSAVSIFQGGGPGGVDWVGDIETGSAPTALASADYNGDGFLDVAVANGSSDDVTYLRGGRNGLRRVAEFAVGREPEAMTSGDYDGDGIDDLTVANRGSDTVTWLRGNSGGLSRLWEIDAGSEPTAVASGDFDGDGFVDAVVANEISNNVTYLRGGPGGLEPSEPLKTGRGPLALTTGDYDGDGFLDLVVANDASRTLTYFRGSSEGLRWLGEFPLPPGILLEGFKALASGDYDGDGLLDVAASNDHHSKLEYLKGDRSEFLEHVDCTIGFSHARVVAALASGDYDGDGFSEVVSANRNQRSVTYLRGGPGGLCLGGNGQAGAEVPAGDTPVALASADYDGDGFVDVAVANRGSDDVTYLQGGSEGLQRVKQIPVGRSPVSLTSADYDGDGFVDVIVANQESNDATYLPGGPDGLRRRGEIDLCPLGRAPAAEASEEFTLASGDFNGDGFPDVVVPNQSGTLTLLRGTPAGPVWTAELAAGIEPKALASGDFDGDGFSDLVVANFGSNNVTYFRQRYLFPHASAIVSRSAPGYHLDVTGGVFPAPTGMEKAVSFAERWGGLRLLEPRLPPRYQLELSRVSVRAPTQVCVIPGTTFDLPQGEAFQRAKYLLNVTDPVCLLRETTELAAPGRLTLRLRDHDPALFEEALNNRKRLRVLRKNPSSGMGESMHTAPRIVSFHGGRGVTFPVWRFGSYVVAIERARE